MSYNRSEPRETWHVKHPKALNAIKCFPHRGHSAVKVVAQEMCGKKPKSDLITNEKTIYDWKSWFGLLYCPYWLKYGQAWKGKVVTCFVDNGWNLKTSVDIIETRLNQAFKSRVRKTERKDRTLSHESVITFSMLSIITPTDKTRTLFTAAESEWNVCIKSEKY